MAATVGSMPYLVKLVRVTMPFVSMCLASEHGLFTVTNGMSFDGYIQIVESAFGTPFPLFFAMASPPPKTITDIFSGATLTSFATNYYLPYDIRRGSDIPSDFSTDLPVTVETGTIS